MKIQAFSAPAVCCAVIVALLSACDAGPEAETRNPLIQDIVAAYLEPVSQSLTAPPAETVETASSSGSSD